MHKKSIKTVFQLIFDLTVLDRCEVVCANPGAAVVAGP